MKPDWETPILSLLKTDPYYQQMLCECEALEREYVRIASSLTKEESALIDKYIAICEEMQYREVQIAYAYGLQNGDGCRKTATT